MVANCERHLCTRFGECSGGAQVHRLSLSFVFSSEVALVFLSFPNSELLLYIEEEFAWNKTHVYCGGSLDCKLLDQMHIFLLEISWN